MAGEVYIDFDLDFARDGRGQPVVAIMQYSKILPVLRARLYCNGVAYSIPSDAAVKIRYGKPDGSAVYEAVTSASGSVITYAMSEACAAAAGECRACFEIAASGGVLMSPVFAVRCTKNPLQNTA